jgi:hypothetical protein
MAFVEQQVMANSRAELPSHDAVLDNLRLVARLGLGHSGLRADKLRALLSAAQMICGGDAGRDGAGDDAVADASGLVLIERALQRAVGRLDDESAKTMAALFGIAPETRGLSLTDRRKHARETRRSRLETSREPETFRTHHERALLALVASSLQHLVDEQQLKDREAQLAAREVELNDRPREATAEEASRSYRSQSANSAETGSFFDDDTRMEDQLLQPSRRAPVKRVRESGNALSALAQIGDGIGKFLVLMVESFEPPRHYGHELTPIQRTVVACQLLVILFVIASFLLGAYTVIEFFAHRIVEL